ncbi:hypothetical protein V8E53_001492 [Lactarius tabidus]
MTFALPGSVFLACRAALQRPQLDADVPVGRVADACLYWYSCKNDKRSVNCTLHYAEPRPEEPITAGLYDIETTLVNASNSADSKVVLRGHAHQFEKVPLDCEESISPKQLPARILVTGSVDAIEDEIRCFVLDLRQAFLEDTTTSLLSVFIFMPRERTSVEEAHVVYALPKLHQIVSITGRLLSVDENRLFILLDTLTTLE